MTNTLTANRLGLIACLSGITAFVSFGLFNLNLFWSELFPGVPFLSLLLGLAAIVLGIMSRRRHLPGQPSNRACAWVGIICGCGMILLWIGIAILIVSIMFGEPM